MKKILAILLIAVCAFAFVACGNDDDAGCTEDDVTDCIADYTTCTEGLDVTSDTYLDDFDSCTSDYCDCLNGMGCDLPAGACD